MRILFVIFVIHLSFTEKTKIYSFAPAKSMGCSVTLSWSSFVPWYLFKCRWGNFMASRRNGSNTKRKKDKARKTPLVSSEQIEQIQKTNYPQKQKQTNTQEQQQHACVVPPNSRVVMTSMTVVLPSFCAAHAWRNASPT